MLKTILNIILESAYSSYIEVTVFVAAALLVFGYIDYKRQGGFINYIEKSKRLQPLIGALIGLTPGCGGAIFIMPLYVRGKVSFGTVVAALIATAGDSAFVMITKMPLVFLAISGICFVIAVISGYAVDSLKLGQRHRTEILNKTNLEEKHPEAEKQSNNRLRDWPRSNEIRHIGHEEGDAVDMILHHKHPRDPDSLGQIITHKGYIVFWILCAIGLILGVMGLMQVDINGFSWFPNAGWIIGITGTAVCIALVVLNRKMMGDDSHEDFEHKLFSLKETFIHNGMDIAFVGTWVFIAYMIYNFIDFFIVGEALVSTWILSAGLTSVIIGAVVGLIPGCGPQIIFVALYSKGALPFAALLSNAISQDGDALFPLLAMDKKSAIFASIITTIPALIIGVIAYFIETGIFW